jgi:hypothetical protein
MDHGEVTEAAILMNPGSFGFEPAAINLHSQRNALKSTNLQVLAETVQFVNPAPLIFRISPALRGVSTT